MNKKQKDSVFAFGYLVHVGEKAHLRLRERLGFVVREQVAGDLEVEDNNHDAVKVDFDGEIRLVLDDFENAFEILQKERSVVCDTHNRKQNSKFYKLIDWFYCLF